MLTKKQHALLMYIDKVMRTTGICPSYEEMCKHMKLKSKSGIYRLVNALEHRGFLHHIPNKARALEILALPEEKFSVSKRLTLAQMKAIANDNSVEIPLFGKIACGTPIEAVNTTDVINVPGHMVGAGEHYALTVEGDSMKNVGIMDGDTVIIKRVSSAINGTIVVALVDGFEVTLKRIQAQGRKVALVPENEAYETRVLDANQVEVQGKLVGLLRSYH